MNVQEWAYLLWQEVVATDALQWVALGLGVSEVLFARANKIWLYPTGIAATALSIYILFNAGLYAECLLSLYYIVMSVYGWWYWVKKKDQAPVKITFTSKKEWISVGMIVCMGFVILSVSLKQFTDSTVPYWDAWVSCTAWAGMWLLAKRKVENWVLLNISNAFAIPLLLHKHLPMYAALTLFLFIVAIQGYFKWNRIAKQAHTEPSFSIH